MKRILSLFLAALMLVTVGTTALAVEDTVYTSGDYEYTLTEDGEVKITGYAKCNIVTDEKNFDIYYFDTEEHGLISSGSEIFAESVTDYYGEVENVRLTEVKTKKGKTYKAVPVLGNEKTNKKEEITSKNEETSDDLPF